MWPEGKNLELLFVFNKILLQQIISGVYSLRIPKWFKSIRFPADWLSTKIFRKCSQHIARFKAGTILNLPAKTGKDNNNNIAVINIAHTNNGSLCNDIPLVLILRAVLMKFIAPNNDETPAKYRLNIAKSTEPPECDCIPANGGYQILVTFYSFFHYLKARKAGNSVLSHRIGLYLYS